jgi:hypothetical protein
MGDTSYVLVVVLLRAPNHDPLPGHAAFPSNID